MMKVRICPECGKHNPVKIAHCSNCGQMLSIYTIVELDNALVELDTEALGSGDDEQELSTSSASPQVVPTTEQLQEPSTPLALKSYKWIFLGLMLLNTLSSIVRSDPYTPLAVSILIAVIVNGVIVGLWYLLYKKMVAGKSSFARWILLVITFPLGLILLSSSIDAYMSSEASSTASENRDDISKFIGKWENEAGNFIVIQQKTDQSCSVSFFKGPNSEPVLRPYCADSPSLEMDSYLTEHGTTLEVELWEKGKGYNLHLTYERAYALDKKRRDSLVANLSRYLEDAFLDQYDHLFEPLEHYTRKNVERVNASNNG